MSRSEIHAYLSAIGRRGGKVKSAAKAKSSAANGKLGGRPKKKLNKKAKR